MVVSSNNSSFQTLLGAFLVLLSHSTVAGIVFDCPYGPTPIDRGANPTFWAQFTVTPPQLGNPLIARSVTITNTATSGTTVWGPYSVTRTKPFPPPEGKWIVQNVGEFPPFTATWALGSRAVWTDLVILEQGYILLTSQDFCSAGGLISPPGGGGGGGGCAIEEPAMSVVTLAGEVQTIFKPPLTSPLTTKRMAEDGRYVISDEFATASSQQFGAAYNHTAPSNEVVAELGASPMSEVGATALYVRHQAAHPDMTIMHRLPS